jgi:hypothetical protein
MTTRALSIDERKAAEAAFQGKALDPDWTIAAQQVYAGVVAALSKRRSLTLLEDVATAV